MQQAASEAARRAHHHLPLQQYPLAPADAMSQLSQSTSTSHSHTAQSLAQAKSVHLPQAPGQTIAPTNPEHGCVVLGLAFIVSVWTWEMKARLSAAMYES